MSVSFDESSVSASASPKWISESLSASGAKGCGLGPQSGICGGTSRTEKCLETFAGVVNSCWLGFHQKSYV